MKYGVSRWVALIQKLRPSGAWTGHPAPGSGQTLSRKKRETRTGHVIVVVGERLSQPYGPYIITSIRPMSCMAPYDHFESRPCRSAVRRLPEMHADGNDKKITTLGRVSDLPASYRRLFLSADAIGDLDLTEQRNRWRSWVRSDRERR